MLHTAWLLLGTNLGNRSQNLRAASGAIRTFLGNIELCSHIYETQPWGKIHQPAFYNQALKVTTPCTALETLHQIKQIEFLLGRESAEKWSPRIIDIDILIFDDLKIESPLLTIPHAHMHQRNFTLQPLNEIAPDLIHPVFNTPISSLYVNCTDLMQVKLLNVEYQF